MILKVIIPISVKMDEAFLGKSMFTWYKEMLNLDQQVTDETIIVAAQVNLSIIYKSWNPSFDRKIGAQMWK